MARRAITIKELTEAVWNIHNWKLKTYADMDGKLSISARTIQNMKLGKSPHSDNFLKLSQMVKGFVTFEEFKKWAEENLEVPSSKRKPKPTEEESIRIYNTWTNKLREARENKAVFTIQSLNRMYPQFDYKELSNIVNRKGKYEFLEQYSSNGAIIGTPIVAPKENVQEEPKIVVPKNVTQLEIMIGEKIFIINVDIKLLTGIHNRGIIDYEIIDNAGTGVTSLGQMIETADMLDIPSEATLNFNGTWISYNEILSHL